MITSKVFEQYRNQSLEVSRNILLLIFNFKLLKFLSEVNISDPALVGGGFLNEPFQEKNI